MSFPTTQWGIQGNPLLATSAQNPTADWFTTVPGPTSTTPGSSDGPNLGNFSVLLDGTFVQFLQASAIIAANLACQITNPWQLLYQVKPTAAVGNIMMAVNDRSQASMSANYCTWFTRYGLAFPKTLNGTAAGAIVAPSTVSGQLYTATVGTDGQWNLENTVLVGGSPAASPVFIA